eukprot:Hpha_TRINITY_DN16541_c0_g4::TRINITY_DN16541_c0_g4_i5::g.136000::m.136000
MEMGNDRDKPLEYSAVQNTDNGKGSNSRLSAAVAGAANPRVERARTRVHARRLVAGTTHAPRHDAHVDPLAVLLNGEGATAVARAGIFPATLLVGAQHAVGDTGVHGGAFLVRENRVRHLPEGGAGRAAVLSQAPSSHRRHVTRKVAIARLRDPDGLDHVRRLHRLHHLDDRRVVVHGGWVVARVPDDSTSLDVLSTGLGGPTQRPQRRVWGLLVKAVRCGQSPLGVDQSSPTLLFTPLHPPGHPRVVCRRLHRLPTYNTKGWHVRPVAQHRRSACDVDPPLGVTDHAWYRVQLISRQRRSGEEEGRSYRPHFYRE